MEHLKTNINRRQFLLYWTLASIVLWLLLAIGSVVLGVGIIIGLAFALVWTPRLKELAVQALGVEILDVQDKVRTSLIMASVIVVFAPLLGMILEAIPALKDFLGENKPLFLIILSCFMIYKLSLAVYEWRLISILKLSARAWIVSNLIGLAILALYVYYYSTVILAPYAHQPDALVLAPIFLLLRPELGLAILLSSFVNAFTIVTGVHTESLVLGNLTQQHSHS